MNPEQGQKKVDESWKEQVERERHTPPLDRTPEPPPAASQPRPQQQQPQSPRPQPDPGGRSGPGGGRGVPQSDFSTFLSSLSMQAMVALGEVAHPVTGAAQMDLEQARYLIDVLGVLQEKTQGNLTPEEAELMEGLLYELRMKYVEKTQGKQG